jgi:hypothetical protein
METLNPKICISNNNVLGIILSNLKRSILSIGHICLRNKNILLACLFVLTEQKHFQLAYKLKDIGEALFFINNKTLLTTKYVINGTQKRNISELKFEVGHTFYLFYNYIIQLKLGIPFIYEYVPETNLFECLYHIQDTNGFSSKLTFLNNGRFALYNLELTKIYIYVLSCERVLKEIDITTNDKIMPASIGKFIIVNSNVFSLYCSTKLVKNLTYEFPNKITQQKFNLDYGISLDLRKGIYFQFSKFIGSKFTFMHLLWGEIYPKTLEQSNLCSF